jgi:hypothetical protein
MQWATGLGIPHELLQINATLERFGEAMARGIVFRMDLGSFIRPLDYLEKFLLAVTARDEPGLDANLRRPASEEVANLLAFSRHARLLILESVRNLREKRGARKESRLLAIGRTVWHSGLVRNATGVGLVSGIVMLGAVWGFGLDRSQAFFAWFMVTFGALGVSVGVVSFRSVREQEEQDRGALRESR